MSTCYKNTYVYHCQFSIMFLNHTWWSAQWGALCTIISEVNLSEFIYRRIHEDFSSIDFVYRRFHEDFSTEKSS